MPQITQNGLPVQFLPDGQLKNLGAWNVDLCRAMAEREQIHLTHAHWEVIDVMRRYFETYNISPIYKLLKKELAETLGPDKATDDYLMSLFPRGVLNQGMRLAGIPRPIFDAEREHVANLHATGKGAAVPPFSEFEFNGKAYQVYARGNLVNLEDWNEALAEYLAQRESIELTAAHWDVIRFLRKFYFKYGITPMVRLLVKHMRQQYGREKFNDEILYRLFPGGPSRQGSRIAGLPEPQGCIDP